MRPYPTETFYTCMCPLVTPKGCQCDEDEKIHYEVPTEEARSKWQSYLEPEELNFTIRYPRVK